ncbi:MAG TPA: hypothetical protein VEB63_02920 [Chitinophagaceae bacterium]|nr:hypothetical protein [Chitinophagaceae bacterium]
MATRFFLALLCFLSLTVHAQIRYYEGEWMREKKTSHFIAVMKLEMNGSTVSGEIYWKYIAADSSDAAEMNMYKGKAYKVGIELVRGSYNSETSDLLFSGWSENDPLDVIGVDNYFLKYCPDWKVAYGKTWSNGANDGLVFFREISDEEGRKRVESYRKNMAY